MSERPVPTDSLRTTTGIQVNPEFSINTNDGRVSLLLPLVNFADRNAEVITSAEALGYRRKEEFHITTFDVKHDSRIHQQIGSLPLAEQLSLLGVLQAASHETWHVSLRDEFYAINKQYPDEQEPRRSVIQMVDCSKADELYDALNTQLPPEMALEVPPLHVTLAVAGSPKGIGITNHADLAAFGQPTYL